MLVLARAIGETIYIGDDICITVYDRLRYHVTLGVLAPAASHLRIDTRLLRAAQLPSGEQFYLLTLLSGESFRIDEVDVRVRFPPTYLMTSAVRRRQVRIAVKAPLSVSVHREEIYRRIRQDAGEPLPSMSVSDWLRHANQSVSCRAA